MITLSNAFVSLHACLRKHMKTVFQTLPIEERDHAGDPSRPTISWPGSTRSTIICTWPNPTRQGHDPTQPNTPNSHICLTRFVPTQRSAVDVNAGCSNPRQCMIEMDNIRAFKFQRAPAHNRMQHRLALNKLSEQTAGCYTSIAYRLISISLSI